MDKNSRDFFNALNRFDRKGETSQLDIIDIGHITLEEITTKYEKYIKWYYQFLNSVEGQNKIEESKCQKKEYDKMYCFWINPFHIAIRNEIGKTGIPKQEVKKRVTGKEDKAILTQETINYIKSKYINEREEKKYTINSENAKKEILIIIKEMLAKQEEMKEKKEIIKEQRTPIEQIEKYTFNTGVINQDKSYIKKYRILFEENGIEHAKQLYGDIDLERFYKDKCYQRVVLEAIEDLEIENYKEKTKNNYIGSFQSIIQNGVQTWQQEIREGDLDAIKKIEQQEEKYSKIAQKQKSSMKIGEER